MIKKFISLAAIAAMSLGMLMTSCSKDEKGNEPKQEIGLQSGTTYANVSIYLNGGYLRDADATDDYNKVNADGEWAGKDDIESVNVYLVDGATVSAGLYSKGDFTIGNGQDTHQQLVLTPNKAIKTTAGDKKVFVLINAPEAVSKALAKTNATDFENALRTAINVYTKGAVKKADATTTFKNAIKTFADYKNGKDVIMMSNAKLTTATIQDKVKEADAKLPSNPNNIKVDVSRVAARVFVTSTKDEYDVNDANGKKLGTISKIQYSVAQGENSIYAMQCVADGSKPSADIAAGKIATPAYLVKPAATGWADMYNNYDYTDLYTEGRKVQVLAGGSTGFNGEYLKTAKLDTVYLFETNHKYKSAPEKVGKDYDGGFYRNNTPYVLVRATFTPTDDAYADKAAFTTSPTFEEAKAAAKGTFYVGASNGLIYLKAENAKDASKGGMDGQKVRKYTEGKVLYFTYVNPESVANKSIKETYEAPVFRNNLYHVSISGFKAIGHNWNPLFPEDPSTRDPQNPDPKPGDNPDEPDPIIKPDDPLGNSDTFMSVTVNVLKWKLHSYDVELDI